MSNHILGVLESISRRVEAMSERLAKLESADGCLVGARSTVNTTDATVTTLATIAVEQGAVVYVEARVVARRTGGSAGAAEDGATYMVYAALNNPTGAAAALIAPATVIFQGESQGAWNATIDTNGNTARVRVTGAVNNNVAWVARCMVLRATA